MGSSSRGRSISARASRRVVRTAEILPQPGWTGLRADVEVASAGLPPAGTAIRRSRRRSGCSATLAETVRRCSGRAAARRGLAPGPALRRDDRADAGVPPARRLRALERLPLLLPLLRADRRLGRRAAGVHRPHGAGAGRPRVRPGARRDGGARRRRPRQPDRQSHARRPLRQDPRAGGHPLDRGRLGGDRVGEAAKGSGVEVGDVVLTLDGEPVAAREATLRRYLAASTEAGMRRKIADRLLSGPRRLAARADRARPRGPALQRCG